MNRFVTHKGVRYSTASHRRFVTFVKHPDSEHPLVILRTDNVHTARTNHSSVQRRFMGSTAVTIDMVGGRVFQPGHTIGSGLAWIKPEALFPTIPGRPANDGETEDDYLDRVTHENNVTESASTRHGSME